MWNVVGYFGPLSFDLIKKGSVMMRSRPAAELSWFHTLKIMLFLKKIRHENGARAKTEAWCMNNCDGVMGKLCHKVTHCLRPHQLLTLSVCSSQPPGKVADPQAPNLGNHQPVCPSDYLPCLTAYLPIRLP